MSVFFFSPTTTSSPVWQSGTLLRVTKKLEEKKKKKEQISLDSFYISFNDSQRQKGGIQKIHDSSCHTK